MKALTESLKEEAAKEAEEPDVDNEQQAETGASPSDDQIVEKKEEGAVKMQSQDEQTNEMQVALLNGDQQEDAEADEEPEQFDEILAVQHWAMQTTEWKLLNVLIELVDDKQLQYTCKNGDTIFEVFAHVIQLALWRPYTGPTYKDDGKDEQTAVTQVRSYIMRSLLPTFINKSLPFLSGDLTIRYLELFEQAMEIEVHLRDSVDCKKHHMEKIQTMHQQLLECKGVRFDAKLQPRYQKVFACFFSTFASLRAENLSRNGFSILRMYLVEYHKQLIDPLANPQEKEAVMMGSDFLVSITDHILTGLEEFQESIREEA